MHREEVLLDDLGHVIIHQRRAHVLELLDGRAELCVGLVPRDNLLPRKMWWGGGEEDRGGGAGSAGTIQGQEKGGWPI